MSAAVHQQSAAAPVTDQDIHTRLLTGLRNRWYPILPSRMVETHGRPVGLTRLGEKLVVWRDNNGAAHVQIDRCPHRAVPMSKGVNEGTHLRCIYHGVAVGPDGTVLEVPGQPGCSLEGRKATKTFPSFEMAGAIFVWFGDELHQDPGPFTPPVQFTSDEYGHFLCFADWRASWRYINDNLMDPMHGTYLHHVSHSMNKGERQAHFRIREVDMGFIFEKEGQIGVNFDWSEFVDCGAMYVRLEIPYPKTGGPGGNFGIVAMVTPVDETNSSCFFWRWRKVSGWQRDVWRFLYRTKLEPRHWHVLEQDRELVDGCGLGLEDHEILYQHDAGLVRLRRYLNQQTRAQLTELRGAGKA